MVFEVAQCWQQLGMVYNSFNPQLSSGAALRNLGLMSGQVYGASNRSYAICETTGTIGTVIPQYSIVTDDDGNEFYTAFEAVVPANLQVVSSVPGVLPVPAGTITGIKSPLAGWSTVAQSTDGVEGKGAQTEQQFRNTRQQTVMRNAKSVADVMKARLVELGVEQANIVNNTHPSNTLPDGTPPNTIHVTVGELGATDRGDVARVILKTNSLGCPTYGNTSEVVLDSQGNSHTVYFSVSSALAIKIVVDVTYLSLNTGGASQNIVTALNQHINSLISGEDVIISRLYGYITPYAKAQVNTLTIGALSGSQGTVNVPVSDSQFAIIDSVNIVLSVDGVVQ